ncbi:hypothetical protein [Holospora curviuscula]|uniref:Rap1a immunity protein domain-containing protein n=1 Tax=Holospora curviuscula TaxID=1082868 RepID=A0A2S5R9F1_9PROT|nr:hypothetical protein [Holospora curviuscula]PPE03944.1 hypothetical protein HCUR_00725 [Holospora curviuscula]
MQKIFKIFLWAISLQAYSAGADLIFWIRSTEKRLCGDPVQCQRYLALSPKGKAVVLQALLRRSEYVGRISEIQVINWILKEYQCS